MMSFNRRDFFRSVPGGICGAALASLLRADDAPYGDFKPRRRTSRARPRASSTCS